MQKINIQEIWKPIAECNGEYLVSNLGRVKSLKFGKEKILKQSNSMGYLRITLKKRDGKQKTPKVHRLVALAFIPNPNNKPQVNHKDGNKYNNHIDNLEWSTCQENVQHGWENGLYETTRKCVIQIRSKPVIDRITQCQYPSLIEACRHLNLNYSCHLQQIHKQYTTQRFEYIKL